MFLVALMLMALTGCATPAADHFTKHFEPGQASVISPNEAVIFGKFVRALDGEIKADEERSFSLIPFKDTERERSLFALSIPSKVKYTVTVDKESHFYLVIERDSYVIAGASFGNRMTSLSAATYTCLHFGFHMPEQADAYYIGTLFFDLKWGVLPLFSHRGTVRVRDEFEEESKAFKRRNPEFTGKIVKSLLVADKSVPPPFVYGGWVSRNVKPWCQDKAHIYEIIYE